MANVAIACQGGGSHTAFTAGVLERLLADERHRVVALSGTSGGAIDAVLAWFGLLAGGPADAARLLDGFWRDMSATSWPERLANDLGIAGHRTLGSTFGPEISPYLYPSFGAIRLRRVLERHVDFSAVPALASTAGPSLPALLVGAVEVRSGRFTVFRNAWDAGTGRPRLEVGPEAVLASAAVPTLFRAVPVGDGIYWDGLFSQNPPVRDLPDTGPDEIWVVQVNPTRRDEEPVTISDIRDRRNELAGNLSLRQELHFIEKINKMVRGHGTSPFVCDEVDSEGVRKTRSYREIKVFCIELDEHELGVHLDTESKLNREPRFIRQLFECGERQAKTFLDGLAGDNAGAAYAYR